MRFPFFGSKDKAPAAAARPAMGGDDSAVQAARTQARRRLVGALVLLVIGVVGFPLLFETQPRPLPVDTPILVPGGTPARVSVPPSAPRTVPALPPADAGTEAAAAAVTAAAPVASSPASAPAPSPAAASAPAAKPASAAASEPAAAAGRYVVQVGAYNDMERLKAARAKLEKLGFRSYTQDVDTPTGKRTRVRVGPYGIKADAEAAAAKVKAAGMQAAILTL